MSQNQTSQLKATLLAMVLPAAVGLAAVYVIAGRPDNRATAVPVPVAAATAAQTQTPAPAPAAALPAGAGSNPLSQGEMATFVFRKTPEPLPAINFVDATGAARTEADLQGRVVLLNLWATWCPPCRREMPVLENAQQQRPDLTFLFVNQAESMQSVATFLETQGLSLTNVLFDRSGRLGQAVGSMALPTTLFYSPDGRLLASHLGELSNASLARAMENFDTPNSNPNPASAPATSSRKLPCPASATC